MTGPTVSVIMSVYNGARDVPAAAQSILAQTFADFELIAIDNGSFKDNSREVLGEIARGEPRVRVIPLDTNIGLAGALNHGIGLARGRYIARQDHDDISRPERLAAQVAFMDAHPQVGLLGTRAEIHAGGAPTGRAHDHPTENAALQFALLFNNPFVHSSVMIRRSVLDQVGLYTTDPARQPPEDYELWSRIARVSQVTNLPDRHLIYAEVAQSMSRVGPNPFLEKLLVISAENVAHAAGLPAVNGTCRDVAALIHVAYGRLSPDADIEAICGLLRTAAHGIEAKAGTTSLVQHLESAISNMRHHFALARRVPGWMRMTMPVLRYLPAPLKARLRALLS